MCWLLASAGGIVIDRTRAHDRRNQKRMRKAEDRVKSITSFNRLIRSDSVKGRPRCQRVYPR